MVANIPKTTITMSSSTIVKPFNLFDSAIVKKYTSNDAYGQFWYTKTAHPD